VAFVKQGFLFKIKEDDPILRSGLSAGILQVFRGIKFESDTELGQKALFYKGHNKGGLKTCPHPNIAPDLNNSRG